MKTSKGRILIGIRPLLVYISASYFFSVLLQQLLEGFGVLLC